MKRKIAYLIIAHTDPLILKILVDSLNSNSDFYIHLDKKTDLVGFKDQFVGYENVFFISERHSVQWAGYGIVAAQLSLIKSALESNENYLRLVHLSGLDYPLVSNSELYDNFSKENIEYISGYNITKSKEEDQKNRVRLFHLFKNIQGKSYRIYKLSGYLFLQISRILPIKKKDQVIINSEKADIYFGSQFFAITTDFARYLLDVVRNNPNLVKYFRTSFAPDELFIQTIFFNSKYSFKADRIGTNQVCDLHNLASLHYLEYTSSIKVFTKNDYDTLMNSNQFFVRKVTSEKSLELIKMIDLRRNII